MRSIKWKNIVGFIQTINKMFDYNAIFVNPKRWTQSKGNTMKPPANMKTTVEKLYASKIDLNDPVAIVGKAKEIWEKGWHQYVYSFAAFINVCTDNSVFDKLGIKSDPANLEHIVVYLCNSGKNGKRSKTEDRAAGNEEMSTDIWETEKHNEFVTNAADTVEALLDIDANILTPEQCDLIVACAVIVMYGFFDTLRAIYYSISKDRFKPNYILEMADNRFARMPLTLVFHRHKNTWRDDAKPIVHQITFEKDKK